MKDKNCKSALSKFFAGPKTAKIVILGAGESGTGAALLAQKQGFTDIFVSDFGSIADNYAGELDKANIAYEQNNHDADKILQARLIIKSPGIPPNAAIIIKAAELQIPIIDELEFAYRFTSGFIIAITGSNGKTTTTLLCYHLMLRAGMNVGLGGNVGRSMARALAHGHDFDWWVLEVSSFQLEGFYEFKPQIAILLNITPDHLDRYQYDFEKYIDAKFRIIQNLSENQYLICYKQNPAIAQRLEVLENLQQLDFNILDIGLNKKSTEFGGYADVQALHFCTNNAKFEMPINELALSGPHNHINALAAGLAAVLAGVERENIMAGLSDFVNAPHRLEQIAIWNNIRFINDSKATNTDSALQALRSYPGQKIVWIAGGKDKGNEYGVLEDAVGVHVKALICMGKDNIPLLNFFKDRIPTIIDTDNLSQAVDAAFELAKPGDIVLLSPACASFDLFDNYQDRGNKFAAAVREKIILM